MVFLIVNSEMHYHLLDIEPGVKSVAVLGKDTQFQNKQFEYSPFLLNFGF